MGRDESHKKKGFLGYDRFPKGLVAFDWFLGVEKKLNHGILKNITLGIEGSKSLTMQTFNDRNPSDGEMSVYLYTPTTAAKAFFYDHNLTLGLRVSVGLWK